jgi:dTDP-4-amino-4,6-dideoxygalactose transaminase
MQALLDVGISTRRGISTAHRETAYKTYQPSYILPVSEDTSDRSIVIPLYYPMPQEEIDYVIKNFIKCILL